MDFEVNVFFVFKLFLWRHSIDESVEYFYEYLHLLQFIYIM